MSGIEEGWYADPTGTHDQRYWNGNTWTEHIADDGEQAVDAMSGAGLTAPPMRGVSGKHATRARLLSGLKKTGKYKKPLERGDWATLNFLGGDWNEYANVVLSAAILETLQDIDARLEHLDLVVQRLTAAPSD